MNKLPSLVEEYLNNHSLKENFVKSLGWTWEEDGKKIAIPVYSEDGKLLFSRYRHFEGKNKFSTDKGAYSALYCSHKIKNKDVVVFAEGEPDVVRLWQEGIPAATGTCGVKTFSSALAQPLKGKIVKICLDTDDGGRTSIEQYFNILLGVGVKPQIVQLPQEFKDISDYFTAGATKENFDNLPVYKTIEDWKDSNLPEEFKTLTVDDILATELPEEKWLVDKVIPIEGFCFFVGPEASAKSFHSLTIAKSVVTGEPWLGQFKVVKQTKVLIIDKENTMKRIQDRLRGLKMESGKIQWLAYPQYLEIADEDTESGYTEFIEALSRMVKRENIGLIILDSFTDLLVGEENDRGSIQDFVSAIKQLFPDVAYMVLHHASKYQPGGKRPKSQMARGSSNIMAQADAAFHTESVRKSLTEFTVEQTKARDSLKLPPFRIELQVEDDPNTPGETYVTNILYKGEVQDKEEKLEEAVEVITGEFSDTDRIPQKELKETLIASGVVKEATFRRALKVMEEDGKINRVKSKTVKNGNDIVWQNDANVVYEE